MTVIRKAADELKQAVALSPQPDTYEVFALLIGAVESVNDDDERVLAEARTKWPRSGTFVAGQMGYALRKGDLAGAQAAEALLMDGHLVVSEPAALYARRLQSRLMALQQLGRLDESVRREDFSVARQLAAELQNAPLTVEERQRVDRVRARDASYEMLQRVRTVIAEKDWIGAEIFLDELKSNGVPDALRGEVEKLEAEIAAGKKR